MHVVFKTRPQPSRLRHVHICPQHCACLTQPLYTCVSLSPDRCSVSSSSHGRRGPVSVQPHDITLQQIIGTCCPTDVLSIQNGSSGCYGDCGKCYTLAYKKAVGLHTEWFALMFSWVSCVFFGVWSVEDDQLRSVVFFGHQLQVLYRACFQLLPDCLYPISNQHTCCHL